jgi:ABC-type cobalamin/Fe3+-siderophores transport system ATPase subunit
VEAPVLAVEGLTKTFPGTQALADLTFEVQAGEVHALVGENGAGKTTMLMLLSGVYAPDDGRVFIRGRDAPQAYAAALTAHPKVVGIGGTDGDSGLGATRAVIEAGKAKKIKIMAIDRNDDMLAQVKKGSIVGSVVQKSYDEMWLACWMLYWLKHNQLRPVPDWHAARINPLPERLTTGVWGLIGGM